MEKVYRLLDLVDHPFVSEDPKEALWLFIQLGAEEAATAVALQYFSRDLTEKEIRVAEANKKVSDLEAEAIIALRIIEGDEFAARVIAEEMLGRELTEDEIRRAREKAGTITRNKTQFT